MGDLGQIFCCKCLNALPDRVIFPCGHFVCQKCEDISNCLACGLPVCLTNDSFSLQCYRTMVSEGLLTPIGKGILPKRQVPNEQKPAKSTGVREAASTSQKQKKPRKKSASADDAAASTPRAVRSSALRSCKKLVHESATGPEKSEASVSVIPKEKKSRGSSTEQVIESDKSGITSVNATLKDDEEPHVHAKKARLLKNCLSASKPRLSAAEKVEPKLDDIVRTGSPPLKKRKTASVPRVALTRLSLKTDKRQVDSSEEDDGIFIDSDSIGGCGKTLEVVAQVHADPRFSSATSLDNSQTDEKEICYTQIGLGHLDRDEEQDDADPLTTPDKSLTEDNAVKCTQAVTSHSKQHVSSGGSVSSQDFIGFEDGTNKNNRKCVEAEDETPVDNKNGIHKNDVYTLEMEVIECTGDESIIKSSVPPVEETLQAQILKTPKVRESSKRSRPKLDNANFVYQDGDAKNVHHRTGTLDVAHSDNIETVLADGSPTYQSSTEANIEAAEGVESQSTVNCDSAAAAEHLIPEKCGISDSIHSKETDHMDIEMELSSSCCAEDLLQSDGDGNEKYLPFNSPCEETSNFDVKTPKHSHSACEDFYTFVKKRSSKYLEDCYRLSVSTTTNVTSSESLHVQPDVGTSEDILLQENEKDLPVSARCDGPSDFTVKTPKHSHSACEDFYTFVKKRSSKYLEDRYRLSVSTTTNVTSSESLHVQPDVGTSEDILLQENEKDLPVSARCDGPSDFTVKTPKHSHSACEDFFTLVEKRSSKYLEDRYRLSVSTTTNVTSSESLHVQPDVGTSEDILLQENEKDLPVSDRCDGPSDFIMKTPKHSRTLFEDEVPDWFSFAEKRFSKYLEDRDKISTVANGSSFESLHPHHGARPSEGILLQENEKYLPVGSPCDDQSNFTVETPKHSHTLFEDEVPSCFSFADKHSSKYLEDYDKIPTTTMVHSSESLQPQPDARPSEDIVLQENENGSCDVPSDLVLKTPKNSNAVFEDEVPDCFSFADKHSSKYLEDCDKIPTTTMVHSSESLQPHPDARPSEDIVLQGNENGSCDVPSDLVLKTPKPSNPVFEDKVPDCFSFAGKIPSSYHQDCDKLDAVTSVSSFESLHQPKVSAIITPPSSTSEKSGAEVQRSSKSHSRLPCQQGSSASSSLDISSYVSSQTSVTDLPEVRHNTYQLLTDVFSKIYRSERPKSLIRLAFDVLLLPLKNEDVFQGLTAISPVTASAEKSVQVDLFLEQTTVKVDLGKEPVKRNSFTRRQLAFVAGDSSPSKKSECSNGHLEPDESEDIVEGTPTKAQLVRVNLLNDSTCSPLSRTLAHEDSPAQIRVQTMVNEVPAFSIFDPITHNVDNQAKIRRSQSTGHNAHARASPMKSSNPKTSKLVSPSKQSFKDARTTPQIDSFNLSRPPSSTPKSQPMDSSLAYTDSESIIGDSEQLLHKRKHLLALPLGGNCNQTPKKDIGERINSPLPFRNMSNVFQLTTTGIYDNVEKNSIRKLCGLIKATFSTELTKDTTHLILPDGDDVTVTTKFLMALHNGSYILPMRWVFDCLISKSFLPESDYFFNHPGIHRRMMMPRRAALFQNYAFYLSPEIRKDDVNYKALTDLMRFCNCNITETPEEICQLASRYKAVVLRGADYLPSQNIRSRNCVQVNYQWFYSCLTSYEIQPFGKNNYN